MDLVALLGAGASAIALLMTTLRKRQDVDVSELKTRMTEETKRREEAEQEVDTLRTELIDCERISHRRQRLLARHDIQETG